MKANDSADSALDFSDALREAVLPFARKLACRKGRQLIASGEQARCFYFIEKGTFEVSYAMQKLRNTRKPILLI